MKRKRHHVHLSADVATARRVGARRGTPIVLRVAAGAMWQDGYQLYLSDNGVWLTRHVPVWYIGRNDAANERCTSGSSE